MQFTELNLHASILRAIQDAGYETATPIQAQTIPFTLEGRDVLGCAQTGTGKTAAFALPVLHRLANSPRPKGPNKRPRCLVLCPTRELATQIGDSFDTYGQHLDLRHTTIFGGVGQNPQVKKLQQGVDIVVATPGRLMDLHSQGHVDLSAIKTLILDEADRMLDMGFIRDIQKIVAMCPDKRQTLLFSATMPPAIEKLTRDMMRDPARIETAPQATTAERVQQAVYFVDKKNKPAMLAHLLKTESITRSIVFTRTKYGADKVVRQLSRAGIPAKAIHGNKTQNQRQRSLDAFKDGSCHVLIATDIASRGIDVDGVSHVFNFDLTHEPESYVHRIGRTARAGESGLAISFCDVEEHDNLRAIERTIKMSIPVRTDHPEDIPAGEAPDPNAPRTGKKKPRGQGGKPRRRGGNNANNNADGNRGGQRSRNKSRSGGRGGQTTGGPRNAKKSPRRRSR